MRVPDTTLSSTYRSAGISEAHSAHLYPLGSCGDEALAEFETEDAVERLREERAQRPPAAPEEPAREARRRTSVIMTAAGVIIMAGLGVLSPSAQRLWPRVVSSAGAATSPAPRPTSMPPSMPSSPSPSPSPSPAREPRLSGSWRLTSRVVTSDVQRFSGLVLGYRLRLEQDGERLRGEGVKWTENGRRVAAGARTPIAVEGTIDHGQLQLAFTETGTRRTSHGSFALRLVEDGSLNGRFSSDAARSSGTVTALRAD